jgi:hypothetical protein
MAKVEIKLIYDTDTTSIEDENGAILACGAFLDEDLDKIRLDKTLTPIQESTSLDKLTYLRAMGLSVGEMLELKQSGLLE